MKNLLYIFLQAFVALVATSPVLAQSPPGWGWVNQIGAFVPNTIEQNNVAGLGRDAVGNLYMLGSYIGAPLIGGLATTNQGSTDLFLAKYASDGSLVWLRTVQSAGPDVAASLVVEPSGRCTVAGYFGGGIGGDDLTFTNFASGVVLAGPAQRGLPRTGGNYGALPFIATVDAIGTLLWADVISPTYGLGIKSMQRDGTGNCYLSINTNQTAGLVFNGQAYPPIGDNDAVLLKYAASGLPAWARRVGASGGYGYSGELYTDDANALYWLVGHSSAITIDQVTVGVNSNAGAMSVVKISASNRVRWIKNDLLRVGSTNAVSQLLGFDSGTNALYLSGSSNGPSISFTGGSPVTVMPNALTACVARCDTAGQVEWVKPYGYSSNVPGGLPGPRGAGIYGFAVQGTGFTLVSSTVAYNQTTYYGSSKAYGISEGGLSSSLHFNTITNQAEWVRVGGTPDLLGQTSSSKGVAAVIDARDNVFLAGNFTGTAVFGAYTLASANAAQPAIFLAKLDQTVLTSRRPGSAATAWSVFPNPSTGTAQLVGLPSAARVAVYDALGRVVRQLPALPEGLAVPRTVAGLTPGLYLLQVNGTAAPYQSQRLVVE